MRLLMCKRRPGETHFTPSQGGDTWREIFYLHDPKFSNWTGMQCPSSVFTPHSDRSDEDGDAVDGSLVAVVGETGFEEKLSLFRRAVKL